MVEIKRYKSLLELLELLLELLLEVDVNGIEINSHALFPIEQFNSTFFLGLDKKAMSGVSVILYNRVPKCGSTTFKTLVEVSILKLESLCFAYQFVQKGRVEAWRFLCTMRNHYIQDILYITISV